MCIRDRARVVDSRMPPKLDGSQAKVMDGAATHALIGEAFEFFPENPNFVKKCKILS